MAVLAIDYGRKRIGLALSRASLLADRYSTLDNDRLFFDQLRKIIKTEEVETVLLGVPKDLDGKTSSLEPEIHKLAEKIERELEIPVVFIDEAFTSEQAKLNLKDEGLRADKVKSVLDQESARIILEEYIRSQAK